MNLNKSLSLKGSQRFSTSENTANIVESTTFQRSFLWLLTAKRFAYVFGHKPCPVRLPEFILGFCPMSMTDGCARGKYCHSRLYLFLCSFHEQPVKKHHSVLELFGSPAFKRDIFLIRYVTLVLSYLSLHHHRSRDPNVAFTSGQWMTEVSSFIYLPSHVHHVSYLLSAFRGLRCLSNGDTCHSNG